MSKEIWIFDASDGCEECGAVAGEYSKEPSRPHANCDCSIYKKEDDDKFCQTIETIVTEDKIGTIETIIGTCLKHPNCTVLMVWDVVLVSTTDIVECCKIKNGVVTDDCSVDHVLISQERDARNERIVHEREV